MQHYSIFEGNMERLQKKVTRIQNKCRKYGCDFHFAEVGEEFRPYKDAETGKVTYRRFVVVEAEGIAKVNGWRFIASVENTDHGNIINKAVDVEVPERYYTSLPVCEHCKVSRPRRETYIVRNDETGDFKQVGRNCLCDYTHGMSAEGVASYMSLFEDIIKCESYEGCGHFETYIRTQEVLQYAAETIRHFGYVPSDDRRPTKDRTREYYGLDHGWFTLSYPDYVRSLKDEMSSCGFDSESKEAVGEVSKALEWLSVQEESSNYIHNLKTACSLDYCKEHHFGLLVSLFPAYNKDLERAARRKAEAEVAKVSDYVGNVGDRLSINVSSATCLTSWETDFGTCRLYKFTDENGNIFVWKTSNWIDTDNVKSVKGTVKEHKIFRDSKQTELTRCKVN